MLSLLVSTLIFYIISKYCVTFSALHQNPEHNNQGSTKGTYGTLYLLKKKKKSIYLFVCAGSQLPHVGRSSLTRGRSHTPCIGSVESQAQDHQASPTFYTLYTHSEWSHCAKGEAVGSGWCSCAWAPDSGEWRMNAKPNQQPPSLAEGVLLPNSHHRTLCH